jgi:hypothetical protein
MGQRRKPGVTRESPAEQQLRDQEVLRANRELAAYFKGQRTEREARAALKIIKAFVRERERRDPGSRPALPGAAVAKTPKETPKRKAASDRGDRRKRKPRRAPERAAPKRMAAVVPLQDNPGITRSTTEDAEEISRFEEV